MPVAAAGKTPPPTGQPASPPEKPRPGAKKTVKIPEKLEPLPDGKRLARSPTEGHDAVCFTAGLSGAAFGAGVVHAYLAADRDSPKVAAGISMGAVNAAAMRESYRELRASQQRSDPPEVQEAARWRWYRRYFESLTDRPLDVVWNAIPDQSDFFADMSPIRDFSFSFTEKCPSLEKPEGKRLCNAETASRRSLYLMVKLGHWLAGLPVTVGEVANTAVQYVRSREKYPWLRKLVAKADFYRTVGMLLFNLLVHACVSVQRFPEHEYAQIPIPKQETKGNRIPVPSLGMKFLGWLYGLGLTLAVLLLVVLFVGLSVSSNTEKPLEVLLELWPGVVALLLLAAINFATAWWRRWLMSLSWVRSFLLPLCACGIFALTWAILTFLPLFARQVLIETFWGFAEKTTEEAFWEILIMTALLLAVPGLLLFPFWLFKETRAWLRENGFLRPWWRPLFGWPAIAICWFHLLNLLAYGVLGSLLIYQSGEALPRWERVSLAVFSVLLLLTPLISVLWLAVLGKIIAWYRKRMLLRLGWDAWGGWLGCVACAALWSAAMWFAYRFSFMLLQAIVIPQPTAAPLATAFYTTLTWKGTLAATTGLWRAYRLTGGLLATTWMVLLVALAVPAARERVSRHVLKQIGLLRSLIQDFHLRATLIRLFDPKLEDRTLDGNPLEAVIVAAPLQTLVRKRHPDQALQVWARKGTPVVDALRTALAVPGLSEPTHLDDKDKALLWIPKDIVQGWLRPPEGWIRYKLGKRKYFREETADKWLRARWKRWREKIYKWLQPRLEAWIVASRPFRTVDLVDGAVIQQNPIPALFAFLREHENQALAQDLAANNCEGDPAMHVVYRVPIQPQELPTPEEREKLNNVVDVGLLSLRLAQRRDTQLEVRQTCFVSKLEKTIPTGATPPRIPLWTVFADEIAPAEDLVFTNLLSPSRKEVLEAVAAGCRRTMETIYMNQLYGASCENTTIECGAFLPQIARSPRALAYEEFGIPEVCEHCTRQLNRAPVSQLDRTDTLASRVELGPPENLLQNLPQLSGAQPRIVFVASGGVFRGAFHIGMLAALKECDIKPDLIVGASVGTLMGGALAAMFCTEANILSELVNAFVHVDDQVALTKTLKSAARELGLRGRSIHLSPRQVRRKVRRGSRSDPGFAMWGAPSAFIDALSTLLMIPHEETAKIAGEFVAGHVTEAVDLLLKQVRLETLWRLDIERAVIGTTLLERLVRRLLPPGPNFVEGMRQPYAGHTNGAKRIGYFGTATNIFTQSPMVLGGYGPFAGAPYQYVEAALASSAFPAVFAPRQENAIYPGTGRADIFFSDGGMFDNLPFFPAMGILSAVQGAHRPTASPPLDALSFLRQRHENPDLFIAGALNPDPDASKESAGPFDSIAAVTQRAGTMEDNVKVKSFIATAGLVHEQVGRLLGRSQPAGTPNDPFFDTIVDAAVLPVFPASPDHLNGTFAFCASTGLEKQRVLKSVADGCYQTLAAFAEHQDPDEDGFAAETVRQLTPSRIPKIKPRENKPFPGECPFFQWEKGTGGRCPFVSAADEKHPEVRQVYTLCARDSKHTRG